MSSYSLPAFLADNSLGLDTTLVVTAIVLYFALKLVTNARVGARLPLPPGPPLKPLVGNILSVPREGQWELFTEYKRHYGELVYLEGMGNKILVLNSLSAISDLLDKKGHIYSDRPVFTVVGELMALGQSMPLLPYGKEWREHRKLMHTALSPSAVKKYHFMQEDLAIMMCKDFLDKPEDFFAAVRLTAGKIVLSVTYGLSVGTADDQYITHAEDTMAVIGEATVPGAFLCDLLPILKYAPSWVPFQRKAKKGKDMIEHLVAMPFIQVKKDMAHGIAENSLTRDLLSSGRSDNAEFENRVKWATGAMYGAGGETTYATVLTFIMAMALHPDIQKQAQAEVDDVVGPDRMPRIVDASEMPYVNAVVKEVMRWHPILPLSIARRTSQSDSYKGYFIPDGTVVIPNVWAIAQEDVGRYPAQQFKPERFLDKDHPAVEPSTWAFGFGRRVCPGKHLGENSITALIISILYCFDISPPQSTQLTPAFGLHLVSYPEKFDCQILPRSEIKADVLRRSASEINADSGDP